MSFWVKQTEDVSMPTWLNEALSSTCKYCGSPMLNHYNDDGRCTNRKCSNPECVGFVAARADYVRNLLGIKGIGFARCLSDAQMVKAKHPFELFPIWGIKPIVSLGMFLRLHCFEGVDSEWDNVSQKLSLYTLDELYEKYDGKWKSLLEENKDFIYDNLKYVQLVERPKTMSDKGPDIVYTIMITGTPIGFDSKEHFINVVNEACGGRIVVIHQKTKRQTGVDCLIREPGSTTRGKVDAAKRGGIPIVTSEEFLKVILAQLQKLNNEQ